MAHRVTPDVLLSEPKFERNTAANVDMKPQPRMVLEMVPIW